MTMSVKIMLCFFMVMISEGCMENERKALLYMKDMLGASYPYQVLPSWVDDEGGEANCCSWERLFCNKTTGRITHIILDDLFPELLVNSEMNKTMNFSLLHAFEHLQYLDLSDNNFTDSVEIEGLCGMKHLEELDMSHNNFGSVPECLGNLTSLRVLDLSSTQLSGNVPSFITSLKSLEYISFFDTRIDGFFFFSLLANHSKLEVFRLSSTSSNLHVETETPPWLPSFELEALQLANCNLNSQSSRANFPSFLQYQKRLRLIDLSHNMLQGDFPSWLLNLNPKLETLRLKNNSFSGTLQLPTFVHGLVNLGISNNKFHGQLPENVSKIFPNLSYVYLSKNNFDGGLPTSMVEMQMIKTLDLSNNKFSGELPRQFFSNWTSLEVLSLSHNNFSGKLVTPEFANSAKLKFLLLNNNHFDGEIEDGFPNKSYLQAMDISNNMVSGSIPKWIMNFTSLELLSMSNNLLEAEIPHEICSMPVLSFIDLSENSLSGTLPDCLHAMTFLRYLHLQYNSLTGSIPSQFPNILCSLDLRDNKLHGEISLGAINKEDLRVLLLGGNQLNGSIPHKLCQFPMLKILDLSRNRLTGTIPSCLANITFGPIESTQLTWSINEKDRVSSYNSTLTLNYNSLDDQHVVTEPLPAEFRTKYNIYSYTGYILVVMSGLDLSSNELTGGIPNEIGNIGNINSLNLSHNHLSGTIPESFSNLQKLESLDLSYNKLSGAIPPSLTRLHFLAIFDVSYNNLSGPTPTTGQFANFDDDNYRGNPGLFGFVRGSSNRTMSMSPPEHPRLESKSNEGGENHIAIDSSSFCWGFVSSFITVVLSLASVLWFSPRCCRVWFAFVDFCLDYCLPCFVKNSFH